MIRVLSRLSGPKVKWDKINAELRSEKMNIKQTDADRLAKFSFEDEFPKAVERLSGLLSDYVGPEDIRNPLKRLEDIVEYTKQFNVKAKIFLSPLRNTSHQLYDRSLMLQCVSHKDRQTLAIGGRYDYLIQSFQAREAKGSIRAVGFRLHSNVIMEYFKQSSKKGSEHKMTRTSSREGKIPALPQHCDVVVAGADEDLSKTACLMVVQRLWALNISAELAGEAQNTQDLANSLANEPNCLIVLLRRDSSTHHGHTAKVRTVALREEVEKSPEDVAAYVKSILDARQSPVAAGPSATASQSAAGGSEVTFLLPQHKGKKFNRHAAVETAVQRRNDLSARLGSDCPIVLIETSDAVLTSLRTTRVKDAASWRVTIQEVASPQESGYLQSLQETLRRWSGEGKESAFVFNHRTRLGFFYDLA